MIAIDTLRARLADTDYSSITYVERTGSTNADLLKGPAAHRAVLIAGEQTAGRGRLGRQWESRPGAQLATSVSLIVDAEHIDSLGLVPIAIGVALTDAIEQATLKWPNDLLIDGRKLAGILAEAAPLGDGTFRVVIGFGVNTGLQAEHLPVPHATSLAIAGIDYEDTALAEAMLRSVDKRLTQWLEKDDTLIDDYRTVCSSIGQRVRLETPGGDVIGIVDAVEDDGRIVVAGTAYSAGDVTHLRRHD